MQIISLFEIPVESIMQLLANTFTSPYNISRQQLNRNFLTDNTVVKDATVGCIKDNKLTSCIITKYINNSVFSHTGFISLLSALPDHQSEVELLLQHATMQLTNMGANRIYYGMEPHNFFSGIPNCQTWLKSYLINNGFVMHDQDHYDLIGTLTQNHYLASYEPKFHDYSFQIYNDDITKLETFVRKEFYERWAQELKELKNSSKQIFVAMKDEIAGYCIIDVQYHGALGPIGIKKDLQKMGLGKELLFNALMFMQQQNVEDVVIDWTILKEYYGQFGFVPLRTFTGSWKNL